ncbi:DsbA family protein [Agriterribacter sp.]|uniref:DsbA family protein n=1 Tax=Agriterribacter sp. TaxID=2821509 RepID=UPI002C9F9A8B|nr:DsbA family protein [Agriterribacter sp.]HTN07073.1 DsbA family protein [Agriterribacter sp.]
MMKPLLIYCYDAYCGWCYGFSPVIQKMEVQYRNVIDFEVLSGGMILPEKPRHIRAIADYIRESYKTVEDHTGILFGRDYLWHINNPEDSDWFPNSEKPAIALCIIKDEQPRLAVPFASALQYALHFEGRDLCDDEAYRHLLNSYQIYPELFYKKLHSAEYREKAYYEFALCKQLKVTGFPAVFLQITGNQFYAIAKGYTDYNTLKTRIENVLKETGNLKPGDKHQETK